MTPPIYDQNLAARGNNATHVGATAAAPAISAVIADTGPLAAGEYYVEFNLFAMDTVAVGKGLVVEHRNAANGATLKILGGAVAGQNGSDEVARLTVAANERIRAIAGTAAGAASSLYGARISVYKIG